MDILIDEMSKKIAACTREPLTRTQGMQDALEEIRCPRRRVSALLDKPEAGQEVVAAHEAGGHLLRCGDELRDWILEVEASCAPLWCVPRGMPITDAMQLCTRFYCVCREPETVDLGIDDLYGALYLSDGLLPYVYNLSSRIRHRDVATVIDCCVAVERSATADAIALAVLDPVRNPGVITAISSLDQETRVLRNWYNQNGPQIAAWVRVLVTTGIFSPHEGVLKAVADTFSVAGETYRLPSSCPVTGVPRQQIELRIVAAENSEAVAPE